MSRKIKYLFLILILIFLGFCLTFYYLENEKLNNTENQIKTEENENKNEPHYFIKNTAPLKITAESYLVGDLENNKIILEKNIENNLPIASISKLMTALIPFEENSLENIAQVSKNALATYGKNGDLILNEKIKISDLIYPLLLESSNDASEVIAESFNRNIFLEKMNLKARELKLFSTSFEDPSGLSVNNKSNALDLFNFTKYLLNNYPNLLQITTQKSFNNKKHTWFNNSQFLGINNYLGGKRGYTDKALQTALSVFSVPLGQEENRNIGIILLRSSDRKKDIKNILDYLNKNIFYGTAKEADIAWSKTNSLAIEKEPEFINLLFGGDLMLDRGVKNSVMKNFNGDYSLLFKNLDLIQKSDITFANLEGPASDQGKDMKNLYSFRMNPSIIPVLKGVGFSIVSMANNHAGDWGLDAFVDTLARLKENEILYTGGGNNLTEAQEPIIIEKYGIKIGFLGFSDVGPEWMKAKNEKAGILLANDPNLNQIIQNASNKVDHLIVSFHFGNEYKKIHNARQENLAHRAIDNGAKIVMGHHPHVIQDTEVYKNGFIVYSLGNFIFDQHFSADTMEGMLLEIKLNKIGEMFIKKNIIKLSKIYQPETLIQGKEEKIIFKVD